VRPRRRATKRVQGETENLATPAAQPAEGQSEFTR